MRRKIRKSVMMPSVLAAYSAIMYVWLIPQTDASPTRIFWTIVVNVLIIAALWWVYWYKEKRESSGKGQGPEEKV